MAAFCLMATASVGSCSISGHDRRSAGAIVEAVLQFQQTRHPRVG